MIELYSTNYKIYFYSIQNMQANVLLANFLVPFVI
jgi:hypothetical protein